MKSYKYELVVYKNVICEYGRCGQKVKRFIGNNINELEERFQLWYIKSGYCLGNNEGEIYKYIGEIQHINY